MRAVRWLLVLVSIGLELSELRVERGLATGAVDFPLPSPVQRSVNCNVGPWENVSNGGSLCGTVMVSEAVRWTRRKLAFKFNMTNTITPSFQRPNPASLPSHQEWFPMWLASCSQGCRPSLALTPHTPHPAAAVSCGQSSACFEEYRQKWLEEGHI